MQRLVIKRRHIICHDNLFHRKEGTPFKKKKRNKKFQRQGAFRKFPALPGQLLGAAMPQEEVLKRELQEGTAGCKADPDGSPASPADLHSAHHSCRSWRGQDSGGGRGLFEKSSALAKLKGCLAGSRPFLFPSFESNSYISRIRALYHQEWITSGANWSFALSHLCSSSLFPP